MKTTTTLALLLMLGLGLSTEAQAQTANCEAALADSYLDINNVRARILNNGNLFWRGSPNVYEVPQGSGSNAIFNSGIWLGGLVGGELRMAAARYGNYEFWGGPLGDNGEPPAIADCDEFDRLWKISKDDVLEYETTGSATTDLAEWPTGLGAPTMDADGNPIDLVNEPLASRRDRKIDLAAGERPVITGDQMVWWIMNDRGNTHNETETSPIGVEIHSSAFAFNVSGPIGNTTFYRYRIFYKGDVPLTDAYISVYSDPDLGNFDDDYIGSDTTLGLGYVYNSDNDDEGSGGYGSPAPAAGYDFFQGPLVDAPGQSITDPDGTTHVDKTRLKMTSYIYYNNGGGNQGDPGIGEHYYNYMRARWRDGVKFTFGGDGRDFSETETNFVYTGDPPNFWTEFDVDGLGNANDPADRRFAMSTGPFTINPGDEQEIVFALIWSRGDDNIDSVQKLKIDDLLAQAAFEANFEIAEPPSAPQVTVTELDRQVVLNWGNAATSNNYLEGYSSKDPFTTSLTDTLFQFQGYIVYQYQSELDSNEDGVPIAVYDKVDGITEIFNLTPDGKQLVLDVEGDDTGVQNVHAVTGLTNYETYHFGVQAYGYNAGSLPTTIKSTVSRVTAVPARIAGELSAEAQALTQSGELVGFEGASANIGDGVATIKVGNPGLLTGADYEVSFYNVTVPDPSIAQPIDQDEIDAPIINEARAQKSGTVDILTFDITNTTTGTKIFDGTQYVEDFGVGAPQRENLIYAEGLTFSVTGPSAGINRFIVVENGAGPLAEPDMGAFAFNSNGFPTLDGGSPDGSNDRPSDNQQVGPGKFGIHTGGSSRSLFTDPAGGQGFMERSLRGNNAFYALEGAHDWEWRITGDADPTLAWKAFGDGSLVNVPFQWWDIGIATPDDPSDDIRYLNILCESACGAGENDGVWDFFGDHAVSGGSNDPYSDWVYVYSPLILTPGDAGYQDWVTNLTGAEFDHETWARMVIVNWNGDGDSDGIPPFNQDRPEDGTVFRIITNKPNAAGDVFTLSTANLAITEADLTNADVQEELLDRINVVPNPYKGTSDFEVNQLIDQVRFTNLPEGKVSFRVYTLNGTLIRTLEKVASNDASFITWDLTTEDLLPIASGMYLIHVQTKLGEKVIKFGVVKKRTALNTF